MSLPAGPVFPGIACACLVVMDGWGIAPAGPDNGNLAHNQVVRHALTASERVHLVGMVSEGGVHSAFGHLRALIAPPPS